MSVCEYVCVCDFHRCGYAHVTRGGNGHACTRDYARMYVCMFVCVYARVRVCLYVYIV